MTDSMDRRAAGVNRVTVARIVDICGRDPGVPAFEAESVELSGRGMQVKAPYLPPLGASLVCRLDHDGREIVVEGVVAWQKDGQGGGELGIQFTALDSGSVEALKSLCNPEEEPPPARTAAAVPPPQKTAALPEEAQTAPGTPVKLHIEGLGAPMKARVRDGSTRRLQVGSNLEFLKVGRGLRVEDVEQGDLREARIDSVSIAIDPVTQVPQLVVVLRYEGQDKTPEPSVVDDEVAAATVGSAPERAVAAQASAPRSTDDEVEESAHDGDLGVDEAAAFRGRMDVLAVKVGKVMQHTGARLREGGGSAASRFVAWAKTAGAELGARAANRAQRAPRRTTAPAPVSAAPGTRRLRPQNGESEAEAPGQGRRRKMVIGAAAGGSLLVVGLVLALSGGSTESASATDKGDVAVGAPEGNTAAPTATLFPTPAAPAAPGAQAATAPASPGVVANVPLFGPTPMATLEPAPLGPSPEELARAGVPLSATPGLASVEERMDVAAEPALLDESFDDGKSESRRPTKATEGASASKESSQPSPEDVKPWVSGKLHLPVVHRIKLDKPGSAIKGTAEARGFSVVIPGRKALDSGASISKRDDRIASVKATGVPGGAKVTFAFRGKVPTYKVRLKKDYVEFFISSPERTR